MGLEVGLFFRNRPTERCEMFGTRPRRMASSAISRWLQWLMGRSLSDGFSHVIATTLFRVGRERFHTCPGLPEQEIIYDDSIGGVARMGGGIYPTDSFLALIGGGRSFVHRADVFALRSKAGSGFGVSQ
jgi:hypothetical protein